MERQNALDALLTMCRKCGQFEVCGGTGCWPYKTIRSYIEETATMEEIGRVLDRYEPKSGYTGLRADKLIKALREEFENGKELPE